MGDLESQPITTRPHSVLPPPAKPRWAFWKGLVSGAAIEVPVLAATVWFLARLGVGDPDASFMRIIRLTALFAGLAALLTAGGIGRLAAYAFVDGGRRRAILRAARAHAAASAGLVLIAAIPHGHLPGNPLGFLAYPLAGLAAGALCGVVIGAVCSGPTPVLSDVWSLARRPTEALRYLLDTDDFARFGTALRSRTTHLFDGIFEPAAARPVPAVAPGEPVAPAAPAPSAEPAAEPAAPAPAPPSEPPKPP